MPSASTKKMLVSSSNTPDFRDESVIVTRGRKLIVSHIFTAANYEYCIYWIFHQDGTIQLEIKLTGILNTYSMNPGEDTKGWGTEVYPGVNAHNHQHSLLPPHRPQHRRPQQHHRPKRRHPQAPAPSAPQKTPTATPSMPTEPNTKPSTTPSATTTPPPPAPGT
ncbi:hypothetical protein DID88_003772 [Monilinia fructigena]|uniref:Amine oxidase n=1 Tax=Monilinia fructigena TaxID=38457 RepID=A0A395IUL1_9HELO|nr:hypothetical protein DID88_003772 [Monilinia fructigena]